MTNLKLLYYFDILCPHSFLGYQILQKKLPNLLKKKRFEIDYIPIIGPKIFKCAHGTLYDGLVSSKRNYILHELDLIGKFYDLKRPKNFYWGSDILDKRSVSALLFLVLLKKTNDGLFKVFLEKFFDEIWLKNENVNKVTKFFRIGRELGLELREMDEMISKIESSDNVKSLLEKTNQIISEDALGTPWIEFGTNSHCFVTNEIMRIEMFDYFVDNLENLPEKRVVPEIRRPYYPSPKSTFFEDYSV